MTVGEVVFIIEAYNEKTQLKFKEDITTNYALANNIAIAVGSALAGKKAPTLYEMYPELFVEEKKKQQEEEWKVYKERLLQYANWHNTKG